MTRILLLYATRGGSTAEVANFMAKVLKDRAFDVDIQSAANFTGDIHHYDAVILGSPIYKGIWMTSIWRTVRQLETQFRNRPIWGFSLCVRVLEPGGLDYAQANYLPHNLLDKLNLQDHCFFAGRLENLSLSQRNEFHETYDGRQGRKEGDYRDWKAIRSWTLQIAKHFEKTEAK